MQPFAIFDMLCAQRDDDDGDDFSFFENEACAPCKRQEI